MLGFALGLIVGSLTAVLVIGLATMAADRERGYEREEWEWVNGSCWYCGAKKKGK